MLDLGKRTIGFVLLAVFALCFFHIQNACAAKKKWSYLVFAQRWPSAACLDLPYGKCSVPGTVSDWIIHGLWPTSKKGYPSFCNSSWPFDHNDVKPIYGELSAKWPNIMSSTSSDAFWKHEWAKHGTCAASVKELDGILKYFSQSLQLHDSLNVYEILKKSAIVPDESKAYTLKTINLALQLRHNKTAVIFCKEHKDYKYPLLDTVYLCMDKRFEPIDCEVQDKPCTYSSVIYLLLNETRICPAK